MCSIQVVRSADKVPSNEHAIVQEYIEKPFIVDGFKCDMRIYVLITSCDPLRIFLFNDGLLRMSTELYVSPTDSNLVSTDVLHGNWGFCCCCCSLSVSYSLLLSTRLTQFPSSTRGSHSDRERANSLVMFNLNIVA